jgi:hypothetical protein
VAEVTNELIHEVLKRLQEWMGSLEKKINEVKSGLQALPVHSLAMQQDLQNLYAMLTCRDAPLVPIERRVELSEIAG